MSRRYGRKQRRAALEKIAELESKQRVIDVGYRRQIAQLQTRMHSADELNAILREAKAMLAGRVADAVVHAHGEFMRECLAQLSRQGAESLTIDSAPSGPRGIGALYSESAIVITVHTPPIYRSFVADLPRERRRRA